MSFELYEGVVEDNNDPLKIGRVRVRIATLHSEKNEFSGDIESVSTKHLPWAEVVGSTFMGLASGIGVSSVLKQGTAVWVFLRMNDPNKPVVLGTRSGITSEQHSYKSGVGFVDPSAEIPQADRVKRSSFNPQATGDLSRTILEKKNANLMTSAEATESPQEPSVYPYNEVLETKSGSTIEIDDTPDNERIQIIHKAGSYIEIKISEIIEKAVNDKVSYIVKNLKQHIGEQAFLKVDGQYLQRIKGDMHIESKVLKITNDVLIDGNVWVTGTIKSDSDVFDSTGSLSNLRTEHNTHTHTGNMGAPTSVPLTQDTGNSGAVEVQVDNFEDPDVI